MHSSPSRIVRVSVIIAPQPRHLRRRASARKRCQRTIVPLRRPTHCPFARWSNPRRPQTACRSSSLLESFGRKAALGRTVGPVTRTGRRAQGIAQFMPMTAAERLLRDPFDPAEALPNSAKFLRDLTEQFGNLGLAAAAYNAGPTRVRDWLAGRRTLPSETQAYVRIVTGRRAEEWKLQGTAVDVAIPADMPCGIAAKRPTLNKERP